MRHGFIKVAAVTPKIKVADPVYNAERICEKLSEAYERKAKIIVFPELCITGYTCEDLFRQELLLKEALRALKKIAECTKGQDALVFVGLPVEQKQKLYNAAAVLRDGKILGMIPKTCIPNYGEFYEARHFAPGSAEITEFLLDGERIPFGTKLLFACEEIPALIVGCEICEDMWAAETPGTSHALAGATILVNLSASNETVTKDEYRKMLVESGSARLVCGYVYASAGEGESTQDLVFSGHNMIAENGVILAEAARFTGESVYGELDVYRLSEARRRLNTFLTGKDGYTVLPFSLKQEETKLTRKFGKAPFVPTEELTRNKRCDDILKIQSYGLKKRFEHTGSKAAVIGVSGGLDSTLALLVTAKCFDLLEKDRSDIIAVTMPCFGTTDRTYQNACKLAETLGAVLKEVDIKHSVTRHFQDIGQDMEKHDVTYENGQARERTQVLMDIANQSDGLVIGTGDMSELALGWATYNGDHMSMYGVNAGVPKTLVRHLVQYFADTCGNKELQTVLTDVLDTPVSPELLPPVEGKIAQKTEDLVGPYELHDFFLYYILRLGFSPSKVYRIARDTFGGEYAYEEILKWLKTFYRRFFSQQFKRSCLPDGPKVGSVAVSPRGDLRMPSDACAAIWMREIEQLKP
ncbi:MAG: NAD(+) synthase [Lachnospiraceae bacterium]|nr:NAD(+) synthase [Lachnospiraceae bacterium]